jgi:hypothetical protein
MGVVVHAMWKSDTSFSPTLGSASTDLDFFTRTTRLEKATWIFFQDGFSSAKRL